MSKIKAYKSSDYAGMSNSKYDFYFGYEETDDDGNWLFIAKNKKSGRRIIKISSIELEKWCGQEIDSPEHGLLVGIGVFFNE